MRWLVLFSLVALFSSLMGCAIGPVTVRSQTLSIGELKTIIHQVIPVGIRTISPNGREFLSQMYTILNGEYLAAKDSPTRYTARLLILNSSRPYDIEIEVHKEVRDDEGGAIHYRDKGMDQGLMNLLRTQLKDRLAKRRDDINLLDDFRVF